MNYPRWVNPAREILGRLVGLTRGFGNVIALRVLQFFDLGDVEDGTMDAAPGDAILVQIKADFHFGLSQESGIVIRHFINRAITRVDFERPEGLRVQEFFQLSRVKHNDQIGCWLWFVKVIGRSESRA